MGVDLNKVDQQRLELEQKEAARAVGPVRWWTPEQGQNNIRLLPPWTKEGRNANSFAREIYTHWNIGDGDDTTAFTCPLKTPDLGEACPICEEVDRLRATGDPVDAEKASDLRAKQGFVSNIIDLDDPIFTKKDYDTVVASGKDPTFSVGDTKVQVFRYGPMIYKALLDNFSLLKMDLTDPTSGRDLIVNKTGKGKTGTKYSVLVQPAASPVVVQGQESLDKRMYNLDSINKPRSSAEMFQALNGGPLPMASLPPMAKPPVPQITANPVPTVNAGISDLQQKMMDALKNG